MDILDLVGRAAIIIGALIFATTALGLMRFYDPYSRISALSTAGGIGITLIIIGALFLQPSFSNAVKALFIIILHLITSAVGTMTIARASYLSGVDIGRARFNDLVEPQSDPT